MGRTKWATGPTYWLAIKQDDGSLFGFQMLQATTDKEAFDYLARAKALPNSHPKLTVGVRAGHALGARLLELAQPEQAGE